MGLECAVVGVDRDEAAAAFTEANLTEDVRSIVLLLAMDVVEVMMGEVDCSTRSQPRIVEVRKASSKALPTALSLFSFLS